MSDVSVLSHEYSAAAKLSEAINGALIALKKVYLKLPGAESVTQEQIRENRALLSEILSALVELLAAGEGRTHLASAAARVPGSLVARLQTDRRGDLDYFVDDLRQAGERLQADKPLGRREVELLDALAAAADAERSQVFRQMMRR